MGSEMGKRRRRLCRLEMMKRMGLHNALTKRRYYVDKAKRVQPDSIATGVERSVRAEALGTFKEPELVQCSNRGREVNAVGGFAEA